MVSSNAASDTSENSCKLFKSSELKTFRKQFPDGNESALFGRTERLCLRADVSPTVAESLKPLTACELGDSCRSVDFHEIFKLGRKRKDSPTYVHIKIEESQVRMMKSMRCFMRFAMVGALALLFAGFVAPTNGLAVDFQLTSDHCTGGCGTPPFGTVTLTQVGANVNVVIDLADGPPNTTSWAQTGAGDFQLFKFNATGVVVGDITVNQTFAGQTLIASTGAFNGDGTGNFSFGISCSTCGNGALGITSNVSFTVANATIADLTAPNNLGNIFVADIFSSQTGNTGPVDVTGPGTPVPEPSTIFLYGLGVAMLIAGHKWRKNSLVRNGGELAS